MFKKKSLKSVLQNYELPSLITQRLLLRLGGRKKTAANRSNIYKKSSTPATGVNVAKPDKTNKKKNNN